MSNRMARTESLRSAPVKTELEHSAWGDTMVLDTPADICDRDRKSTRLNSSHSQISYAVFCLKKKKQNAHTVKYHHDNLQRIYAAFHYSLLALHLDHWHRSSSIYQSQRRLARNATQPVVV